MASFNYDRDAALSLTNNIDRYCNDIISEANQLLSLMDEGYWRDEKRSEFNKEMQDNYNYIIKSVRVLAECSKDLRDAIGRMDS